MTQRRRFLGLLGAAATATVAGCGFILGTDSLSFSSSPATASDAALSETDYEEITVEPRTVEEQVSAAGQTRTVEVTNQLARYDREVDLGPLGSSRAAVFVAFTSPSVSVAGQEFNPISDMDSRELLDQFDSSYGSVSVGQRVDTRAVTMLGSETTIERFDGTATLDGAEVDVYVEITDVERDGPDYAVCLAIYPQSLADTEREHVATLVGGLDHDA